MNTTKNLALLATLTAQAIYEETGEHIDPEGLSAVDEEVADTMDSLETERPDFARYREEQRSRSTFRRMPTEEERAALKALAKNSA